MTGSVHRPAFRSHVDAPRLGISPSCRAVVRGWCYGAHGKPVLAVRLRHGRRVFVGTYGDPRPDVAAAFPHDAVATGCGFEIPVLLTAPVVRLELQARLLDGTWYRVRRLTIASPPRRRAMEAKRWRRFWPRVWVGDPHAWTSLTEPERDYAVARVRRRGWFNLFVGAHHAPRPLAIEQFPSSTALHPLPRLAVVTPSYQQGRFLEQTMRSILNQEDVTIDYIVQDGGSTDGSAETIRRYAGRLTHWDSGPDAGQAAAIASGFSRAPGGPDDLMMYLNADDLLLPNAARFVAAFFAAHPDVDVVYGHRVLVDETGCEIGRWFTPRAACSDLRLHNFIPQETLVWRRRVWERAGGIDASFEFALDWDLLLRFAAAGARMARLPWFLAGFRLHPDQKTSTRWEDCAVPEINRLRRRTLGRPATHDELHLAMRRAQLDSALVKALIARGRRV